MGEEVTCAYADIKMFGGGPGFEKREQDTGGRAAPDVRVGYTKDPGLVDIVKEVGRVDTRGDVRAVFRGHI